MIVASYDKVLDWENGDNWDLFEDAAIRRDFPIMAASCKDPKNRTAFDDFCDDYVAVVCMGSAPHFCIDDFLIDQGAQAGQGLDMLDDMDTQIGGRIRLPSSWLWKRSADKSLKSVWGDDLLTFVNKEAKEAGINWERPLAEELGPGERFADPAIQANAYFSTFKPFVDVELVLAIAFRLPDGNRQAIRVYFFCVDEGETNSGLSRKALEIKRHFRQMKKTIGGEAANTGGSNSDSARVAELEARVKELEKQLEKGGVVPETVGYLPRFVVQLAREGKSQNEIVDILLSPEMDLYEKKAEPNVRGLTASIIGALLCPKPRERNFYRYATDHFPQVPKSGRRRNT